MKKAMRISKGKLPQTSVNDKTGLNELRYAGINNKNPQNILIRIANANCPVPILSREYTEKKP